MSAGAAALARDDPAVPGVAIRRSEPMSRHTSMRVGGPAELFCEVESAGALAASLRWAKAQSLPVFVLGGGTNLVVADAGIPGLTVKLGRSFSRTRWDDSAGGARVVVGGAANFKRLALDAIARGFAGLEFAEGIPGTVGGGLLMNAGAFGGEISQVVEAIAGVTRSGDEVRLAREELAFAYRRLDLPLGFVVTSVEIRLARGDRDAIDRRAADAKRKRGRGQPLGLPNAGSIFKNPPGDFAGRLIEIVGLKGARAGGAEISPQHANFIVNVGGARAADVRALMRLVQETVWRRRGVWLQPEVKLVGDWEAAEAR
ncbi:MAG TPA: UDP-N-acetylmuramate dehydrogenase [Candidatus Binatia bacterium]|nr:UDP-N-acetylmuramate dehydrogenase [Candidatus Binatia bacterium]